MTLWNGLICLRCSILETHLRFYSDAAIKKLLILIKFDFSILKAEKNK